MENEIPPDALLDDDEIEGLAESIDELTDILLSLEPLHRAIDPDAGLGSESMRTAQDICDRASAVCQHLVDDDTALVDEVTARLTDLLDPHGALAQRAALDYDERISHFLDSEGWQFDDTTELYTAAEHSVEEEIADAVEAAREPLELLGAGLGELAAALRRIRDRARATLAQHGDRTGTPTDEAGA